METGNEQIKKPTTNNKSSALRCFYYWYLVVNSGCSAIHIGEQP